jgi:hypothetical protein
MIQHNDTQHNEFSIMLRVTMLIIIL